MLPATVAGTDDALQDFLTEKTGLDLRQGVTISRKFNPWLSRGDAVGTAEIPVTGPCGSASTPVSKIETLFGFPAGG
jgi:hypothetical protein